MELYVSDHPTGCDMKAGTGGSEFDDVAKAIGLTENRYGIDGRNHVSRNGVRPARLANVDYIAADESNPYFTYDAAQCIVCSRCVRACEEVQGTFALTIAGRGFESRVSAGMSRGLHRFGMRVLRRLRAGLSDRRAARKIRAAEGPARPIRS